MQDVMDEKGQVLFDNLAWFAKKLCSVMTSASACEHMWSIEGWIHNKRRNRLAQPNVERHISEPDRRTNEQGVDDADEDDIDSDVTLIE